MLPERIQPRTLRKRRNEENWLQVPVEWWGRPVSEFPDWEFRCTDQSEYAEIMLLLDRWRKLAAQRGREVRRLNKALESTCLRNREYLRLLRTRDDSLYHWKPHAAAMSYAQMQQRLADLDAENRQLNQKLKELS